MRKNTDRAAVIVNALQYINDPAQRAKLEGELAGLRARARVGRITGPGPGHGPGSGRMPG